MAASPELLSQPAHRLSALLEAREVSSRELTEAYLDRIESTEPNVRAFLTVAGERALETAAQADELRARGAALGPTAGIPIAIKDNICVKGLRCTCASRILANYTAVYDATVVERLAANAMPILGKTNLDEFAMGSSTENSAFQETRNPWDLLRVPGGSSGGSAAAVAACEAPWSLGSDTGGSIRQPAALCGVVGLKPTYGRVSRYGLVAYASSLDQIGPLTRTVRDAAILTRAICGWDPRDATSVDVPVPDLEAALTGDVRGLRIGVVEELMGEGISPDVAAAVETAVRVLAERGASVGTARLPHVSFSLPVYYLVAPAEASSNLARFDGVRYGHRSPARAADPAAMYARTRAEGFGPEVKRRIMTGTYALSAGYYDAYYLKAQKVRTLIRRDFEAALGEFDLLACPTSPTVAFRMGDRVDDPIAMYLADICTLPVNLAALPALSVPCGFGEGGMPVGLQLIARHFEEELLLRVGDAYERETGWHDLAPRCEVS